MKNDLLLRALKGLPVERPPVWIMRQAGRYLPDYIKLKNKYDFFTRCKTPELVSEITLLPIDQIGTDAAIIFSDILVVLQAMNIEVEMKPDFGPFIPNPIDSKEKVKNIITPNVMDKLGYVFEAIKVTKKDLNDRVPLIGFAGSPWTLFCYLVQGSGSKTFDKPKGFAFANPKETEKILEKITLTTIEYLKIRNILLGLFNIFIWFKFWLYFICFYSLYFSLRLYNFFLWDFNTFFFNYCCINFFFYFNSRRVTISYSFNIFINYKFFFNFVIF